MGLVLGRQRGRSDKAAALRIDLKARVERYLDLGPDDLVVLNEIGCFDPGCPDMQTVIMLMRAGEPSRAAMIGAPMNEVTEQDLEVAAASLLGTAGLPRSVEALSAQTSALLTQDVASNLPCGWRLQPAVNCISSLYLKKCCGFATNRSPAIRTMTQPCSTEML